MNDLDENGYLYSYLSPFSINFLHEHFFSCIECMFLFLFSPVTVVSGFYVYLLVNILLNRSFWNGLFKLWMRNLRKFGKLRSFFYITLVAFTCIGLFGSHILGFQWFCIAYFRMLEGFFSWIIFLVSNYYCLVYSFQSTIWRKSIRIWPDISFFVCAVCSSSEENKVKFFSFSICLSLTHFNGYLYLD